MGVAGGEGNPRKRSKHPAKPCAKKDTHFAPSKTPVLRKARVLGVASGGGVTPERRATASAREVEAPWG